jgi:hypothetical protein
MKDIILICLQILLWVIGTTIVYAGFSIKYPPFVFKINNPVSTILLILIIVLVMAFGIVNQREGMNAEKNKTEKTTEL